MFNSRTDIKSFLSTLVRVIHINVEFLVLDEPINRRNLPAREALEKYLERFNGRLLVVSYDRYFLDKITNRITGPTARRFTIIRATQQVFASCNLSIPNLLR